MAQSKYSQYIVTAPIREVGAGMKVKVSPFPILGKEIKACD
jgi:hypothetical protein